MSSRIQAGRISNAIQRLLGFRGRFSLSDVSPEIVPVILVGDTSKIADVDVELRPCIGAGNGVGTAVHQPTVSLNNLTGSGVIVRVKRIWVSTTPSSREVLGFLSTGAVGIAGPQANKTFARGATAGAPQAVIFSGDGVSVLNSHIRFFGSALICTSFPVDIWIGENQTLALYGSLNGASEFLDVTFEWEEQPVGGGR